MCDEPDTLAGLMATADKYATADSAMHLKNSVDASSKPAPRYNNQQVAAVAEELPAEQGGGKQCTAGRQRPAQKDELVAAVPLDPVDRQRERRQDDHSRIRPYRRRGRAAVVPPSLEADPP